MHGCFVVLKPNPIFIVIYDIAEIILIKQIIYKKGAMSMKKRILALILLTTILTGVTGCNNKTAKSLSEGVEPGKVEGAEGVGNVIATNHFSLEVFKRARNKEGNTIISPFSVLCALAMTANGAEGDTLAQMEDVLGMSVDELNQMFYLFKDSLPNEKSLKMTLSNSIWFTEHVRFTPNEEFLQTNADYYGAEIYEAPFDQSTVKDINEWIDRNTDGMIKHMIDEISDSAVMYLINALTFDAEWSVIYENTQIRDGRFTMEDGKTKNIDYMHSEENYYLESEHGIGVMKPYKGGEYAFVALLPKEGMSVEEYLNTLDGEELSQILANMQNVTVETKIPKFEMTYEVSLTDILQEMGMKDAVDVSKADFTSLGTSTVGNIYMDEVLHKAYINVDEKGTKAGAVTIVAVTDGCMLEMEEPKKVYLDRPFIYMIVDMGHQIPMFIGTYMEP